MNITTSFNIGDTIFVLQLDAKLKQVICEACGGHGSFTGQDESIIDCPMCRDGFRSIREKSQYYILGPFTVGKVSVEITESQGVEGHLGDNYKPQSKREESYMCEETGVGSGVAYRLERGVFGSREEAQAECDKRNKAKEIKDE